MKLQPSCPKNLCTCGYAILEEGGRLVFHGRRIAPNNLETMTDKQIMEFCWGNSIDIAKVLLGTPPLGVCRRTIGKLVSKLEKIEKNLPSGGVDEVLEGCPIGSQGRTLSFED